MEIKYTAWATSVGGREGHVKSSDGLIDLDLRTPKEMGGSGEGSNPEQLFAAAYSACFNSALGVAARLRHIWTGETTVVVQISLGKTDEGNYQLAARIEANIPGVTLDVAKELVEKANTLCPYSRATRGNIEVELHATANG